MTERMNDGVPQADGSVMVEPRMDVDNVARAVVYMANLPAGYRSAIHDCHGDEDALHRAWLTGRRP